MGFQLHWAQDQGSTNGKEEEDLGKKHKWRRVIKLVQIVDIQNANMGKGSVNGRTHVQEDKWTTQEGEPQGEHQVLKPPPGH